LIRLIAISLLLLILPGCYLLKSPAERLDYLLTKYPGLATTDTVRIADTLIIDSVSVDTIHTMSPGGRDTIIIRQNNVVTKVIRHIDTLRISTDVASDTIIRTQTVTVDKIKHIPMGEIDAWEVLWSEYKYYVLGIIVLLILLIILKIFKL
jgi:hypothetical protein